MERPLYSDMIGGFQSVPLKIQYPLLFELAIDIEITVDQVIGYNRFYLFFTRNISSPLRIESMMN
jgi:hypothetical protein